MLTDRYKFI